MYGPESCRRNFYLLQVSSPRVRLQLYLTMIACMYVCVTSSSRWHYYVPTVYCTLLLHTATNYLSIEYILLYIFALALLREVLQVYLPVGIICLEILPLALYIVYIHSVSSSWRRHHHLLYLLFRIIPCMYSMYSTTVAVPSTWYLAMSSLPAASD